MNTILITGASKGFGYELLKCFLLNGWQVFPLVRSTRNIQDFIDEYPQTCIPIVADVTEDITKQRITEILEKNTKHLDILVNNAGNKIITKSIFETTEKDMLSHFQVHCVGAMRVTKASYDFLINAKRPIICNITSRKGSLANTNAGMYSNIYSYQIAKSAQNMLTSCMNQEFKNRIKIYAIHPGKLRTSCPPPDADTEPEVAANKFYQWVHNCDDKSVHKLHDIIEDKILPW